MKLDEKIFSVIDTVWGEIYRTLGLRVLFNEAECSYRFDKKVIDGVVDGSALSVRGVGSVVRKLQTGRIQVYIGCAVLILFLVLWFVVYGM